MHRGTEHGAGGRVEPIGSSLIYLVGDDGFEPPTLSV